MSYMEGYKDAIELFERTINRNIRKGNNSRKELVTTLDNMIPTVYIAKLALADKEEEYLEGLLAEMEQHASGENLDLQGMMNKEIDKLIQDMFNKGEK